jgi:hypothetical protein
MTFNEWYNNTDKDYIYNWYGQLFREKVKSEPMHDAKKRFDKSYLWNYASNIKTKELSYIMFGTMPDYSMEEVKDLYYKNRIIYKQHCMDLKLNRMREDFV